MWGDWSIASTLLLLNRLRANADYNYKFFSILMQKTILIGFKTYSILCSIKGKKHVYIQNYLLPNHSYLKKLLIFFPLASSHKKVKLKIKSFTEVRL